MRALHRWLTRFQNFSSGQHGEERFLEEIETHIAEQTADNIRAGMSREEASRQARLKFGSVEAVRGDYHAEVGLPFLEDLFQDIHYALRILRKSPTFTLVALLTLMLGIGANVVVFGVVNAVLLHPLEVSNPQNLYQVRLGAWTSFKLLTTSYPAYQEYRQRNTTLSAMAGYYGWCQARMSWGNSIKSVSGYAVTGNYFEMLGVLPELGRLIQTADEHGPNSAPYIVLSDSLWRNAFNADPGVIGTTVRLNQDSFTVVGVAPAQFHGTERFVWPDYFIPIVNYFENDYMEDRTGIPLVVLSRLKPGVTSQQAAENLSAISAQLARDYPKTDTGKPIRLVRPGLYADDGDVIRGFLYSVTGLALLVLLAACANLASLFAARAADRSRELALRVALGASRWRLVRQLMTEAVMLSLLGGAAGLMLAILVLSALSRWQSPSFLGNSPATHLAVSLDGRVYLAAFIFTLVSALLFGMIPAWQVWQSIPLPAMKSGPKHSVHGRRLTIRDLLLGAQIAICMLLVTSSIVAVRGMVRLLHAPLGFQPNGAMLVEMDLSLEPGGDVSLEKKQAMLDAIRNIPGVVAAGSVSKVPFHGGLRGVPIFRPGTTDLSLANSMLAPYVFGISPGYFEAAGTRLLGGRDVSWSDNINAPRVAIVNETFARQMWGDMPAVGQRFIVWNHLVEVIGVVETGKYHSLQEAAQPVAYLPLLQDENFDTVFVVRSRQAQNEITAALERTLGHFVPNAPIKIESWSDSIAGQMFPARASTVALGIMGLFAAMLALTGIFGMAAYNVSRRMKELGIRVALGASKMQVMTAAVGRPMMLLGIGSFLGLLLAVFANQLLGQIVYQANPSDPVVIVGAVLTMALLGVAASAIPALRALALDAGKLMRED